MVMAGSGFAAKMAQVKDLLLGVSLVAVSAWCIHGVIVRARAQQHEERQIGEIVIAGAPDGSLHGRWPSPAPAFTPSK